MVRLKTCMICLWMTCSIVGCVEKSVPTNHDIPPDAFWESLESNREFSDTETEIDEQESARIQRFCSDCHAMPKAESFEREVWYEEIRKGFEFYARSGRTDLELPTVEQVVRYYRKRAPEKIEWDAFASVDPSWQSRFKTDKVDWTDREYIWPGISSLLWTPWGDEKTHRMLVCDARDGSLSLVNPDPKKSSRELITRLQNPARVHRGDLNNDGLFDWLIADLGSIYPYEHRLGKVLALLREPNLDSYKPVLISENLGRITDAAVGDLMGDSNPEVVIAEFGHRETGGLHLLQNKTESEPNVRFESKKIDLRPGIVRVSLHDWNRDGLLDITVLVTQESECIDIYLNRNGQFERSRVWEANDLTYGSVAMELIDLDRDGDMDILLCNGDTFDNNFANRSHGVQWIENKGELKFEFHRLADLPGAYSAKAGDIDQDGDLDIIAVANLPENVNPRSLRLTEPPSIVLLEQTGLMQFTPRVLSRSTPRYTSVELGDFDSNGKLDFCVGALVLSASEAVPRLTFWWQQ